MAKDGDCIKHIEGLRKEIRIQIIGKEEVIKQNWKDLKVMGRS